MEFKQVSLADKAWVDEIVALENSRSADFNFGNLYIWDRFYRQLIARQGDRMLTQLYFDDEQVFLFPIGRGPLAPAIEAMQAYAKEQGFPLSIKGVTEEHRALLEKEYPGKFAYTESDDHHDYIYLAEKLATYPGRSLHGKKNCCNRFCAAYEDWDFVPLGPSLFADCTDMMDRWLAENKDRLHDSIVLENRAVVRGFEAFEELGMEGGALRVDGLVVAFSVGKMITEDTFDVFFEKAMMSYEGSYPMVCRETCRMMMEKHKKLKYINREDDLGLDYLRTSKQSYKPEYILKKYMARWIDG